MVTARIAGLSPGTSPPPVRIPITPFLVLIRSSCDFNMPPDSLAQLTLDKTPKFVAVVKCRATARRPGDYRRRCRHHKRLVILTPFSAARAILTDGSHVH